jgi:DNA polymerase III subunit delta
MPQTAQSPSVAVIFGDEEFQKSRAIQALLDVALPGEAERAMSLSSYDGTRPEEQGGPVFAAIMDDLGTLPFLSKRRVVLIRDADKFVSENRERLERYISKPSATGTLILDCRSFPKTTRLYKAVSAGGGDIRECRRLSGRALTEFVMAEARAQGKRLDYPVAARLVDLLGAEQGVLASEVEKLSLYAGPRPAITLDDVTELVGQSREEKIFAVMDAAAGGTLAMALALWRQVLATDPAAIYRAIGGMAYVVRRWLAAHRLLAEGLSVDAIAPKVMMYGRARELDGILRRLTPPRLRRLLAGLAELDSQSKVGERTIEAGVEGVLAEMAR